MIRRDDWLQIGLAVLARDGEAGLRIDRLAAELGVTKGSFHHHFAGAAGFRTALLARHETEQQALIDQAREKTAATSGEPALTSLVPLLVRNVNLPRERAIRAWAVTDTEAAATVDRIDNARLDLLVELWQRTLPVDAARSAALAPHLTFIGAVAAGVSADELEGVFKVLATTIPAVRA